MAIIREHAEMEKIEGLLRALDPLGQHLAVISMLELKAKSEGVNFKEAEQMPSGEYITWLLDKMEYRKGSKYDPDINNLDTELGDGEFEQSFMPIQLENGGWTFKLVQGYHRKSRPKKI